MLDRRLGFVFVGLGLAMGSAAVGCGDDNTGTGGSSQGGSGGTTTTSSSSSGPSSSSSGPTTGPGGGAASFVGRPCTGDASCGSEEGARCITTAMDTPEFAQFWDGEEANVGGPAGGYCTKDCMTTQDCPADAVCLGDDTGGFCVLTCTEGPSLEMAGANAFDPIPANKCHGREDLTCIAVMGGAVCMPNCGSDTECGGRQCDYRSNVCADAANTGDPIGSGPCLPDDDMTATDEDTCQGICLSFQSDDDPPPRICSKFCTLGGSINSDQDCGGAQEGLCAFANSTAGLGDLAFCTGSCAAHDTCNYTDGFFCFDIGLLGQLGVGYCFGTTDCPNGQSDCDAEEICTDTTFGPVCLEEDPSNAGEPLFPLGMAGGQGGAGGGTGGAGGSTGGSGGTGGAGGSTGGSGGTGGV